MDESSVTFQSSISGPGEFGLKHIHTRKKKTDKYRISSISVMSLKSQNTYIFGLVSGSIKERKNFACLHVQKYTFYSMENL